MRYRAFQVCAAFGIALAVTSSGGACAEDRATPPKLTKVDIDAMMKSLSNWGRWGAADQLGTLNLITPGVRQQAAREVTDGVTVSLAHPVVKTEMSGSAAFGHKMVGLPKEIDITSSADEYRVVYHGFTQTHLDALCHLFYKGQMYNGFLQQEVTERGAAKLSVANVRQGIFTRGVLFDLPHLLGVRFLQGGHAIVPADLDACEKAMGLKVKSGDAVLIRTGRWTRADVEGDWEIMKSSAGLHASCLKWLKDRDVALVGSDLALDVLPSGVEGFDLPVHWVVVVAMGMPILDNGDFEALAAAAEARKRWTFLLTVAPLVVEGGTGSPINPLATF